MDVELSELSERALGRKKDTLKKQIRKNKKQIKELESSQESIRSLSGDAAGALAQDLASKYGWSAPELASLSASQLAGWVSGLLSSAQTKITQLEDENDRLHDQLDLIRDAIRAKKEGSIAVSGSSSSSSEFFSASAPQRGHYFNRLSDIEFKLKWQVEMDKALRNYSNSIPQEERWNGATRSAALAMRRCDLTEAQSEKIDGYLAKLSSSSSRNSFQY